MQITEVYIDTLYMYISEVFFFVSFMATFLFTLMGRQWSRYNISI